MIQDIKAQFIKNLPLSQDEFFHYLLSNDDFAAFNSSEYFVFPGFCDVHVHFREPGFSYKETIASGSAAAAHGGFTAVCTMPNLNPVPDCCKNLDMQLDIIKRDALISVFPYASISVGENGAYLSDMEALSEKAVAFSDDGKGVQSEEMMRAAMLRAKALSKLIAAHCEDNSKLNGGYIHAGKYAARHAHKGISSESEYIQVERDLRLAEETGCAYHVCHVSTKESLDMIRRAKSRGVDVSCETAPHYLLLSDDDIKEDGSFKMNPPLRDIEDKAALLEGLKDGTIDMIASDHAPHSRQEKAGGLKDSLMGISGIETVFPLLYTELVMKEVISLEKLVQLMSVAPKQRFGIDTENDFTVFNLSSSYEIDSEKFLSKGKSTPFKGKTVFGECVLTVHKGKTVYRL